MAADIIRILRRKVYKTLGWVGPEGEQGIRAMGHREYVGGRWDELGKLQFDYVLEQGLKPSDCLLDIACGSLRGGVHFINYLEPGNYLGIDKERMLIELGIEKELGREAYEQKHPEFVVSSSFEFEKFSKRPQVSLAHSLLTHLDSADVRGCLTKLRQFVDRGHLCLATFFEGEGTENSAGSHAHAGFRYSTAEMDEFGTSAGWKPTYVGDWNHPRGQMMFRYEAE
jgi:hypothetical protein